MAGREDPLQNGNGQRRLEAVRKTGEKVARLNKGGGVEAQSRRIGGRAIELESEGDDDDSGQGGVGRRGAVEAVLVEKIL